MAAISRQIHTHLNLTVSLHAVVHARIYFVRSIIWYTEHALFVYGCGWDEDNVQSFPSPKHLQYVGRSQDPHPAIPVVYAAVTSVVHGVFTAVTNPTYFFFSVTKVATSVSTLS